MRFKVPAQQPASFKASALYLAGLVKGQSPKRVEFVEAHNLPTTDPRIAAAMMDSVAGKSVRCKQPQYHFIVTFDPKDAAAGKVTEQVKREVVEKVLEEMGLTEHQSLVYSHRDTDHPHLHFLVNRVHPTEHKAYNRHNDGKRLKEIVRELAIEYDLNILQDRDLSKGIERDDLSDASPSDAEYWRAKRERREPHTPFDKEDIKGLRESLQPFFYDADSWEGLSAKLEGKGLFLERKGQGLVITDGERYAKLSDMGKGVRFKELEDRFNEPFDEFMARRALDLMQGEKIPVPGKITESERQAIEAMDKAEEDTGIPEPVLELDNADFNFRYWSQLDAAYRAVKGRVVYAERNEVYHMRYRDKQKQWVKKREASFLEIMATVFKDPKAAERNWQALEKKYGLIDADRMVRENPTILGAVKGFRFLTADKIKAADRKLKRDPFKPQALKDMEMLARSKERKEAKRMARYLDERRKKYREAQGRLGDAISKFEKARHKARLAYRDYEMFQQTIGSERRLNLCLLTAIRRRARALGRVTKTMLHKSELAQERKEQLDLAMRRQEERARARSKQRERGKALGLDLDLFDD